jgi:hypothetical protein
MHCVDPGTITLVRLQLRLERLTLRTIGIDAPEEVVFTTVPAADDAPEFSTPIVVDVAVVFAANVNVAMATAPFPIRLVFMPYTMHLYRPAAIAEHAILFCAALDACPVATETLVMSAGEYANVHIRAVA